MAAAPSPSSVLTFDVNAYLLDDNTQEDVATVATAVADPTPPVSSSALLLSSSSQLPALHVPPPLPPHTEEEEQPHQRHNHHHHHKKKRLLVMSDPTPAAEALAAVSPRGRSPEEPDSPPPYLLAWDIETDRPAPNDDEDDGGSGDEDGDGGCERSEKAMATPGGAYADVQITCASACGYRWSERIGAYEHRETVTWFGSRTTVEMADGDGATLYRTQELSRTMSAGVIATGGGGEEKYDHLERAHEAALPHLTETLGPAAVDPAACNATTSGAEHLDARGVQRMLQYLQRAVERDGAVLVTWNGAGFDLRVVEAVLRKEAGKGRGADGTAAEDADAARRLAMGHVDLMFQFFCDRGYAVGLGKVARAMLPENSNEKLMSGADAPAEWASGERKRQALVLAYCDTDARLLGDIAVLAALRGQLRWHTRRGNIATWRLPRPFARCTVRRALGDPEPDVSWMHDCDMTPWHRSKFVGWLNKEEKKKSPPALNNKKPKSK